MAIKIVSGSQIAPNFEATDVLGKKFKLSNFKEGYTLLVFLRYSGCPWCNLAIHRLSLENRQMKEQNCQIVAIIQSDKDNVIENIYDRHELKPQFPIIADRAMEIYKKYDVNPSVLGTIQSILKVPYWVQSVKKYGFKQKKIDGKFFLVPAWFLINNRTDRIVKSKHGISFYNHESFIDIYDTLLFKE